MKKLEYNLLLTGTLCLLALGAVMVFSASSTTKILSEGGLSDSAFYLQRTLLFGAVGLAIMYLASRHGLGVVRRLTPVLLAVSFLLLVVVLIAGTTVNGAKSWLGGGFMQFQPSELAKLALILHGADVLARDPKMVRSLAGLKPYLLVVGVASLLIVVEPDLGTMLVIAFAVAATLIAAGARIRDLLLIGGALAAVGLMFTLIEPYRMARLTSFLDPGADTSGAGFQAAQARIALGSGGLFGVGIGNGVQKAFYLPEAHTDMISAVIGEELGLIGVLAMIGLFGMIAYAGLQIARKARDRYGKILVAGLTSLIVIQAMVNLFAVMGMAPLTGVPLPFVSYGNNNLLVLLFGVGLILNVARGGTARAGKLRVVEGGRASGRAAGKATSTRKRSASARSSSKARSAGARRAAPRAGKGGGGGRGNGGTRRTGDRRRRRASG